MWETIYIGHDNLIDLQLLANGEVVGIASATRVTVAFGDTLIDSDVSPAAFDWSVGDGVIHLSFGEESIDAGAYKAVLTIYDTDNTNGVVWGDFRCYVIDTTVFATSVITKTDDYFVQTEDFGKTIRVDSALDITQTLPLVGAIDDGAKITFIKLGDGKLTIAAAVDDKFFEGSVNGTLYNDIAEEIGALVTLEYVDAIQMWASIAVSGTWVVT